MAEVEIPNRALFKASEVCELAGVQPYVLRSWESEFPDLGVSKSGGGPRVYRRADVERVLRIKQLVFTDGLTLAGCGPHRRSGCPGPRRGGSRAVQELLGRNAKNASRRSSAVSWSPRNAQCTPWRSTGIRTSGVDAGRGAFKTQKRFSARKPARSSAKKRSRR